MLKGLYKNTPSGEKRLYVVPRTFEDAAQLEYIISQESRLERGVEDWTAVVGNGEQSLETQVSVLRIKVKDDAAAKKAIRALQRGCDQAFTNEGYAVFIDDYTAKHQVVNLGAPLHVKPPSNDSE